MTKRSLTTTCFCHGATASWRAPRSVSLSASKKGTTLESFTWSSSSFVKALTRLPDTRWLPGLTQIADFLVEREVERGLLVEVLREHRGASRPFSLVCP